MLVDYFSDSMFDFVILDIGNNLCEGNRKLAAGSEYRYWLTDRDETASDLVAEAVYGDLSHHKVNVRSGIDKLPIIADNQIRRLFNIDDERNSDQVRGRDR